MLVTVERDMRLLALLVCVASLGFGCAAGWGQETNAPPGNSGVDEYLESLPGATGNRPAQSVQSKPGKRGSLSEDDRTRLSRLGRDGRAAASLAAASGPNGLAASNGQRGGSSRERVAGLDGKRRQRASSEGDGPLNALANAALGKTSGGMGIVLPLILLLALVGSVVVMIRRWVSSP